MRTRCRLLLPLAAMAAAVTKPVCGIAGPMAPDGQAQAITVIVDGSGDLQLEDGRVLTTEAALEPLQSLAQSNPGAAVYVKADRRAPFSRVSEILDLVRQAGFHRVALIAAN